jgi:antitoxin CcdA
MILGSPERKASRELEINLSVTLEQALQEKLAKASADKWASENRYAIKVYNEFVGEHGCFGEEYRKF